MSKEYTLAEVVHGADGQYARAVDEPREIVRYAREMLTLHAPEYTPCAGRTIEGRRCGRGGDHDYNGIMVCYQHRDGLVRQALHEVREWSVREQEMAWVNVGREQERNACRRRSVASALQDCDVSRVVTYVLRQDRYVKIGRTRGLRKRIASIENGSCIRPPDLPIGIVRLAALIGGDQEWSLHDRWADRRRAGEWFEPDDEMEAWIAEVRAEHDDLFRLYAPERLAT